MAGGLIQLVAYGVQDLYLTGDPQITFFKVLYRRHTNFAIESVVQNFSSTANFGETVSCTISRSGDLVGRIFLFVEVPSIPKFINQVTGEEDLFKKMAWVNNLGYALIQEIYIEIGGKLIDKQYGEWMYIWSQVSNKQDRALDKMIGNLPSVYEFSNGKPGYQMYIPLEFWFCRNIGLALPLISLASSDVKLTVTFRKLEECYRIGPTHSIELLDDIVPFKEGDFIEQTTNGQSIYGYVMGFDYLQKKLYYIKIQSPNASKKTFESYQENLNTINTTNGFNPKPIQPNTQKIPREIINNTNYKNNVPYRIYNSITKTFVTPKPNTREQIEQINLYFKPQIVNSFLYVDYVYLDTEERNKFAASNHEYLIEQIQFNQEIGIKSPNVKQNLSLNHPCKAIYWVAQMDSLVGPGTINDLFNYTNSPIHYAKGDKNANNLPTNVPNYFTDVCPTINSRIDKQERFYGENLVFNAKLILNGRDRFGTRTSEYFNLVEPYEHHHRGPNPGINVYSFAMNPEQHQPSSAINMSKIDYAAMQMKLRNNINNQNTARVRSYTISYNILRIFFNLGGLAFV
ncbi:mg448 protein [Tupanvirus deep ocean]|uniref:Mg448 protein n=2 Tax=Tupanvirus TaxID=2094720 RepID=A0AC62A8L3_9VIRU|nr:mg448 protein [Tupanvirus deep ocean]QKU34117.1 mg448 protein [Tupanvirus deep ocean]